jgi:hypothetical protein
MKRINVSLSDCDAEALEKLSAMLQRPLGQVIAESIRLNKVIADKVIKEKAEIFSKNPDGSIGKLMDTQF